MTNCNSICQGDDEKGEKHRLPPFLLVMSHGEIWKVPTSASLKSLGGSPSPFWWHRLMTRNKTHAMVNEGMVVTIIYLIWEKSGTSLMDEATMVVSESGESLSPK